MATNTYAMTGGGSGFQGGGPGQRVNPGNDAFGGGSLTRASNPVGVGGSFTTPSATGGPPPNFGTPAAAYARNDRGSNIRIPYARVVSMHARDKLPVDDPGLTGTGRNDAYEYDGLEPAELAWIMSKQFSIKPSFGGVALASAVNQEFSAIASPIDVSSFGGNLMNVKDAIKASVGGAPLFGVRGMDGAVIIPSAGMGGSGVNRMERMAYTRWVESLFKHKVGRQVIDLKGAVISTDNADSGGGLLTTDNYNAALDSEIEFYSRCWRYPKFTTAGGTTATSVANSSRGPATGASLFAVPDIAYMLQAAKPGVALQAPVPMMQGLYVMEKGPFLRSYGTEHTPVSIELDNIADRAGYGRKLQVEVDRHLGSDLAQRALLCELKKAGLLNWTPDGICLSKDHTGGPGDPNDQYFDARLGQLFNIGIQGPCITKSWSNLGATEGVQASNSDMVTMPMDKVFILLVGELSYELAADAGADVTAAAALTKTCADQEFTPVFINPRRAAGAAASPETGDMIASIEGPKDKLSPVTQNNGEDRKAELEAQLEKRIKALDAYVATVKASSEASLQADVANRSPLFRKFTEAIAAVRTAEASTGMNTDQQIKAIDDAEKALKAIGGLVDGPARYAVADLNEDGTANAGFKANAKALRAGDVGVAKAELMNFRLMRCTSSYLANKSHFKPDDPRSRCGLKIGYDVGKKSGNAEYILGGWCVGTVVDSAASRALGHNGIRSAPSTYAINVNVNVEWWNSDKLYTHYQDKERDAEGQAKPEGTTFMRTINHYRTPEMVIKEEIAKNNAAYVGKTPNVQYDLAVTQLRTGAGDVEGIYKQPSPYGADTDPKRIGAPNRNMDDGAYDERVWSSVYEPGGTSAAAGGSLKAGTDAHATKLGL